MADGFAIAQVTPFAWERRHEVNEEIARLSDDLAARGHRVVIVAPSTSATAVRDGRKLIRQGAEQLLRLADGEPLVLPVSESLGGLPWRRRVNLPSDVTRTLGDLFDEAPFDICHVHEPFAPGLASAALRSSRALNVGSFHAPAERLVATQGARRVVQLSLPVVQVRDVSPGEPVGYSCTWTAEAPSMIATLSGGYADGLLRSLSNNAVLWDGDTPCPLVGRVSMDLLTVDVTHLREMPKTLDILGPHQTIDELADAAGSISYEIITGLGARYQRRYLEARVGEARAAAIKRRVQIHHE